MTAVAPPNSAAPVQTPADPSPSSQPLSWEGDKMFNIYIYDYCYKRGFHKTANQLLLEADIPSDSSPPINARQGLLFEWWSVFWVLFTAKANGNGSEDAMLYTQHQAQLAAMRSRPSNSLPGMMPQPGQPGRPPVNGAGRGFPPNGPMANGIQPTGQPAGPTAFAGSNGVMTGAPFNQQQRGSMSGPPRPPNGGPPFQSPTMAHSPPNSVQPPQNQSQPPMGGLHRGSMLPPGIAPQPTPAPYPPNMGGRPPSPTGRTSTPQPGMVHQSPSMAPRQPPMPGNMANAEMALNGELQSLPPQLLSVIKHELGLTDKSIPMLTMQEKQRMIQSARMRLGPQKVPPPNATAGPSTMVPRRNNKRNSTSPGEDLTHPDDGSSPPNAKRIRTTPEQQPPIPTGPMPAGYPQPQGGPPPMNNGMMRPMGAGPMANGFPHQQPPMSMGMLGMPSGMSPQMQPQAGMMYRPGGMHPNMRMPGNINSGSPGSDPSFGSVGPMPMPPGGPAPGQFAPGPNRLPAPGQQQPTGKPMSMLPPPSPAKEMGKDTNKPGSSPRNPPMAAGSNTGPPTPQGGMAPSPGLMMNPNGPMNPAGNGGGGAMSLAPGSAPPTEPLFSTDFMQNMGGSLEDVDLFFRQDADINFERDFGQWFNSADDVPGMDLVKQ
ncbi:hypothetical protein MIND_00321900 [Mycena indigotica]|uniref:LisH domain-containing protein n=1 Tax=Mycena indigotica TaxID=2126181 RepID=A0A8H6WAU2_9AGAR|nr:uncharacterized protein MIND_00321900 [Mycena indigotica]KAF7309511.1 hypothetical protein MIND_00321900 [Mycena indigotica]